MEHISLSNQRGLQYNGARSIGRRSAVSDCAGGMHLQAISSVDVSGQLIVGTGWGKPVAQKFTNQCRRIKWMLVHQQVVPMEMC